MNLNTNITHSYIQINKLMYNIVHDSIIRSPISEEKSIYTTIWDVASGDFLRQKKSTSIKKQIFELCTKLSDLEGKTQVTKNSIVGSRGEIKIIQQQNILALRELMIDVQIEILNLILEAANLTHGKDSDNFDSLLQDCTKIYEVINNERSILINDESKFSGIRHIFDQIITGRNLTKPNYSIQVDLTATKALNKAVFSVFEGGDGEDEEDLTSAPPDSVAAAKEDIAKEFNLRNLSNALNPKTKFESLEFKKNELKDKIAKINDTISKKGAFEDAEMQLSIREIANLKEQHSGFLLELNEIEIQYTKAEIDIKKDRLKELSVKKEKLQFIDNEGDYDETKLLKQLSKNKINILESTERDIHSEIEILSNKVLLLEKKNLKLAFNVHAQKEVNQLLENKGVVSKLLNLIIDKTRKLTDDSLTFGYNLRKTSWGNLLSSEKDGLFSTFEDTISKLKNNEAYLKAKLNVLKESLSHTQARLGDEIPNYIDLSVQKAEGSINEEGDTITAQDLKNQWETEVNLIESTIEDVQAELADSKIALRGAFLERLIQSIGNNTRDLKFYNEQFIELKSTKSHYKYVIKHKENLLKALSGEAKIEAATTELKEYNTLLTKLSDTIRLCKDNIKKTTDNIKELNQGFDAQFEKYSILKPGERSFFKNLSHLATNTMTKILSGGFAGSEYRKPNFFKLEKQFADFGYSWQEGLKGFSDDKNSKEPIEFFTSQVNSFLDFADTYPQMAEGMVTDIAITLSLLSNQGPFHALISGLTTRAYSRALIGELGRNVEELPKLTLETFDEAKKWKALGDLARWGPLASNVPGVATKVAEGLMEGNITKAIISGALEGYTKATQAAVVQEVAQTIPRDLVIKSMGALKMIMSGESVQQIIDEQARLGLLTMAAEMKRTILKPKTVFEGIKRSFKDNWEAFKLSGPTEKLARLSAAIAVPVLGAFASFITLGALINPVGIAALTITWIVSLSVGMTLSSVATSFLNQFPTFKATLQTIRNETALAEVHNSEYSAQLTSKRDDYLNSLYEKKLLLQERKLIMEPALLNELRRPESVIIPGIEQALTEALEKKYTETLSFSPNQLLIVKDFRDIFLSVAGEEAVRARVKAELQNNSDAKALSKEDLLTVERGIAETITVRLTTSWLKPRLYQGFENELTNIITSYDSVEQFKAEQDAIIKNIDQETNKVKVAIESQVNDVMPTASKSEKGKVTKIIEKAYGFNSLGG